jgi:hypothetical protein
LLLLKILTALRDARGYREGDSEHWQCETTNNGSEKILHADWVQIHSRCRIISALQSTEVELKALSMRRLSVFVFAA